MHTLALLLVAIFSYIQVETSTVPSCDSLIYCQGRLLETVQNARIFSDSKTFVDLILKRHPNETLKSFEEFMKLHNNNPTKKELKNFVDKHFESEGELDAWKPTDYKSNPKFLAKIKDITVREFARNLVGIWPQLARKVSSSVDENPEKHSLIPLPNGFIIPGGRFTEIYYWDSYWIVKGLLISEMTDTVRGILENFLSLVKRYGFIPNGSRVYYLNRSQPPLLSLMVGLYIEATNNLDWLEKHIDTLETEITWWLTNRVVDVKLNGIKYQMARYAPESNTPRPESYYEDVKTCTAFEDKEKEICYRNLKSGAESGWDFSSRWFFTEDGNIGTNLSTIDTQIILPVDLNAYLCRALQELGNFYKLLGNEEKSSKYLNLHKLWKQSIETLLYDKEDGIWYDYDLKLSKTRKGFYPSNLAPLWAGAYDKSQKFQYGKNAAKYLKSKKVNEYLGGIPTSFMQTGEQWDFNNAWPPLQEIVILGLKQTDNPEAKKLSSLFAKRSVDAFIRGYANTQEMFEKYDAINSGQYGGGGEYIVQSGFGWTNGVALSLINTFYTEK